MEQFQGKQLGTMPLVFVDYSKKTFLGSFQLKWIPAGMIALIADLSSVFNELFYIVVYLLLLDMIFGVLRAFHDSRVELSWIKFFHTILKLFVLAVTVLSMGLIEMLIQHAGIDPKEKLVIASLIVIGTMESVSILDHMCYFFPPMQVVADKVKGLLGKKVDQ